MPRRTSKGVCHLCGAVVGKGGMTRHLKLCRPAPQAPSPTRLFHLIVEGSYQPEYWLHLDARADATLEDLDEFLREIWLECCGHLSAFTIAGESYYIEGAEELGGKGMDVPLFRVLRPELEFEHEYDFGTTTELKLRVVAEHEGDQQEPIRLLARNEPPEVPCESCGELATDVCSICIYEGEGWLCQGCAPAHECGEEMLLPVVNSPRVGMCGYTG